MTQSSKTSQRTAVTIAALVAIVLLAGGCGAMGRVRSAVLPTPGGAGLTAEDGYLPDGQSLSPFDADRPAIANLDPALRAAIQSAATDAAAAGVTMVINSGWRSRKLQQSLLDEAIVNYGGEEEARRWVSTPDTSAHVTGDAVDVGPTDADSWLSQHGADYGLCQIYGNEMWHYQLATEPGRLCPPQRTDSATG